MSDAKLKGVNKAINPDVIPMGVPMSPLQDGEEDNLDAPAADVVQPPEEQAKGKSNIGICLCASLIGFAVGIFIVVKLTLTWLSIAANS